MSRLCAECVTDRFLRAWVEQQGEETTCTYCDQDGVCVAVRAVAQEIDRTLRQYYQLAPDEPHVSPDHDNIE